MLADLIDLGSSIGPVIRCTGNPEAQDKMMGLVLVQCWFSLPFVDSCWLSSLSCFCVRLS